MRQRLAALFSTLILTSFAITLNALGTTPQVIRINLSTNDCPGSDPFASMGGGTCFKGNWYPPDYPIPGYPTTVTITVSWVGGSQTTTAPVNHDHASAVIGIPDDQGTAALEAIQAETLCGPQQTFTVSSSQPFVCQLTSCS